MAWAPQAISAAGSVAGLFGSGNHGGSSAPNGGFYQPTGNAWADAAGTNGDTVLSNYAGAAADYGIPQAQNVIRDLQNNPYAFSSQNGVNAISGAAMPAINQQFGNAQMLSGLGALGAAYVPAALANGFDPQNALHDREQQRVMDTVNATNSMYGLNASPFGAGVANQALGNFNLDWQDRLLGRQNTAANTAYTLGSGANQAFTGASNLVGGALQNGYNAATMPYNFYQQQGTDRLGALSNFNGVVSGALAPASAAVSGGTGYMGTGNSAAYGQLYGNQMQFNQGQTLGANFGAGLAGLSDLFRQYGGAPSYTPITPINYYPLPGQNGTWAMS